MKQTKPFEQARQPRTTETMTTLTKEQAIDRLKAGKSIMSSFGDYWIEGSPTETITKSVFLDLCHNEELGLELVIFNSSVAKYAIKPKQ